VTNASSKLMLAGSSIAVANEPLRLAKVTMGYMSPTTMPKPCATLTTRVPLSEALCVLVTRPNWPLAGEPAILDWTVPSAALVN
jgi:hypothetical protein